jgi:predicted nuclease of restriction endonuclease-like (RecB) superfamily
VFESVRTPKKLLAPGPKKATKSKRSKRTQKTDIEKEFKRRKQKKTRAKPMTKEDTLEDHKITSNRDPHHIDFFGKKFQKKDLEAKMGNSKMQIFIIDKGRHI